jgi:hypothetical protein
VSAFDPKRTLGRMVRGVSGRAVRRGIGEAGPEGIARSAALARPRASHREPQRRLNAAFRLADEATEAPPEAP